MTHRFEVDYKQRLEQSRTATNAVRMPRLGYVLYRVYDIEQKKDEVSLPNHWHWGTGSKGPINIVASSHNSGKGYWQQALWAYIGELETKVEPAYTVRWLKPKHATLLRMKGHNVELAELGDKGFKTGLTKVQQ